MDIDMDIWISGYLDNRISGYLDICISGYLYVWISGLMDVDKRGLDLTGSLLLARIQGSNILSCGNPIGCHRLPQAETLDP